ncbi:MAG: YraN family protein [Gammaproteobacteria bacterium]|nr:YraN family protein [Gammaproteobacteria bacterium]
MNSRAGVRRQGIQAERLACDFLEQHGLRRIDSNFRTPRGEIDLIMLDGAILVFVEVRSRKSDTFIHPAETINRRKRRRIILAGQQYLQNHPGHTVCRFDVIAVTGDGANRKIEWIKRAFDA